MSQNSAFQTRPISRRRMLQAVAGIAGTLAAGSSLEALEAAAPARKIVFPWFVEGDPAAMASFQQHAHLITHLSPTWYSMAPDTTIGGGPDWNVINLAQSAGISLHPLISNQGFLPEVATQILKTAKRRADAAARIAELVTYDGYDGINLDFEGTFGASRERYSDFVHRVAEKLHAAGKWVTVDVGAQTRPVSTYPRSSWVAPFDYKALGQSCDAVMIMAYAYSVSQPGPVAPLWWVKATLAYARTQIPARKLVVGLPFYGMRWLIKGGRTVSYHSITEQQALSLLKQSRAKVQRPALDGSPHFSWHDRYGTHVVHYEDAGSLTAKLRAVRAAGAAGTAFWRLGQENAGQWSVISRWLRGAI